MKAFREGRPGNYRQLPSHFFRPRARLGRGARRASSITPGQASESSVRYLPAFHSEMNRCPETPSTRWAWASTIAAACLRLIHLTLVVAAFFVLMLSPLPLLVLKNDPSSGPCQFETLIRSPTCSSG